MSRINRDFGKFALMTIAIFILITILSPLWCEESLAGLPKQSIAIDPILAPLGTINMEYERKLSSNSTLGVSGWYEYKDVKIRWIYLKAMIYPDRVLRGFAAGFTLGAIRVYRGTNEPYLKKYDTAPTFGGLIQNNWLLGQNEPFLIGLGVGARVILKNINDNSPLNRLEGDFRLVVGFTL